MILECPIVPAMMTVSAAEGSEYSGPEKYAVPLVEYYQE
jgi:hypothetical protein